MKSRQTITTNNADEIILYNFSTIFIDNNGKTYQLTPFEKIDIASLKKQWVRPDLIEDINLRNRFYNESGSMITFDNVTYTKSISKEVPRSHEKLNITLWLGSCHLIIVKSKTNKYWFLHYDPWQTTARKNMIYGYEYSRPTYSDLNPLIAYENESANLGKDEELDMLVVHVNKNYNVNDSNNINTGDFDLAILKERLGNQSISSLKIIGLKNLAGPTIEPKAIFDLEFEINSDKLTSKYDNKIILEEADIFNCHQYNVEHQINLSTPANSFFLGQTNFSNNPFTFSYSPISYSPMGSPKQSPRKYEDLPATPAILPWNDPNFKKPF